MLKDEMANELLNTIKVIWDCMYEQKEGCNGEAYWYVRTIKDVQEK